VLRNCAPSIHVRTRRFFLTRRLCECQLWGGAGHRLPDDLSCWWADDALLVTSGPRTDAPLVWRPADRGDRTATLGS